MTKTDVVVRRGRIDFTDPVILFFLHRNCAHQTKNQVHLPRHLDRFNKKHSHDLSALEKCHEEQTFALFAIIIDGAVKPGMDAVAAVAG
jgi:hypothetical protein